MRGRTETGFEFDIEEKALDNMELIEALAEMDDENPATIVSFLNLLLGKEQKKRLYEHVRSEGRVPMTAVVKEIENIFKAIKDGKNS